MFTEYARVYAKASSSRYTVTSGRCKTLSLGLGTGLEVLGISLTKTRAIYFSLFLHDLLDNHYVTVTTGKLDSF